MIVITQQSFAGNIVLRNSIDYIVCKKEELQMAKDLLSSKPFQKVHHIYTRTNLSLQLCEKLHIRCYPITKEVVKDGQATFGAYPEYE